MNSKICSNCKIEKEQSAFNKDRRAKGGLQSRCRECKHEYTVTNRRNISTYNKKYNTLNRNKVLVGKKRYAENLRDIVLKHYGAFCHCHRCSDSTREFLTIEHINGIDKKKRWHCASNGKRCNTVDVYRHIVNNNFPDDITILCMNCNFSRARYGYCPHELKKI